MKSNYIFRKVTKTNDTLMQSCIALYQTCCNADNLQHSCCYEDVFDVFTDYPRLYYTFLEKEFIGFLSAYIIDENSVEICVFVHPKHRNKKIGTTLLHHFLKDYDMENIEVYVRPDNFAGIHFLKQNNFHLTSTELFMSAHLKSFLSETIDSPNYKIEFSTNTIKYIIHDECVGSCHISRLSDTRICLSDVEIFEAYQNKGLGYQFMHKVLREMAFYFHDVILHVTKENIPAYKLYQKLGFQEMESTQIYGLHRDFPTL